METRHILLFQDSRNLNNIDSESVDLIVTSPPYPMIGMWDSLFSSLNSKISNALEAGNSELAFELMHKELEKVWVESYRVLKPGGLACIVIGDATRTVNREFQMFPSHAKITSYCLSLGFKALPVIIWRKQTNAPNKFMGSGMLPPGAYVTLEHEYILLFRKNGKRIFKTVKDVKNRGESAFFWEERNNWFSDIWIDLKGVKQNLNDSKLRGRSAAYPFELAYRLINMFSVKNDTILDPFLGTGTTTIAAIASQRNSIGVELDTSFRNHLIKKILSAEDSLNTYIEERLRKHMDFTQQYVKTRGQLKYINRNYDFPVMTRQEEKIILPVIKRILQTDSNTFIVEYLK
ncbi:MAG: site-specific DNA-methyltransferase [Candidatus Odinarchaeota archaeon]